MLPASAIPIGDAVWVIEHDDIVVLTSNTANWDGTYAATSDNIKVILSVVAGVNPRFEKHPIRLRTHQFADTPHYICRDCLVVCHDQNFEARIESKHERRHANRTGDSL
jgi:hypothetical protein